MHCRLGDAERGLLEARRAVALDPSYAKAHHRLGAALQALGRQAEAQPALATAARLQRAPSSSAAPRDGRTPAAALPAAPPAVQHDVLERLACGLAHGQPPHMALAMQAAALLGPPPWVVVLPS